jgi:hypothetical protein
MRLQNSIASFAVTFRVFFIDKMGYIIFSFSSCSPLATELAAVGGNPDRGLANMSKNNAVISAEKSP